MQLNVNSARKIKFIASLNKVCYQTTKCFLSQSYTFVSQQHQRVYTSISDYRQGLSNVFSGKGRKPPLNIWDRVTEPEIDGDYQVFL